MDVHRSRFVPYPISAISAVAFSRTSDSRDGGGALSTLKLAIGRANGSIEIWDPQKGLWNQEVVLAGDDKSIDGLVWTQDPNEMDAEGNVTVGQQRLFSIASSPAVTEWDLATGQPKRKSTGNFSDVWCLAAQPKVSAAKGATETAKAQELVGGCSDGTLVLLSTADDDLTFKRYLARVSGKRARCMSIVYKNKDTVVAGFADSTIRVYDTRNAMLIRNMSLGAGIPGAPKNAMVWQLRVLPGGDIVSADSNGEVRIWDGKSYSLNQRITGHDADCLDLVVGSDGRTIFSGGLDGKIAVYRQSTQQHGRKSWAKNQHRRTHQGEVKAMASFDSKHLSVVVSGGKDAALIVTPMREYGKEYIRGLSYLPAHAPVVSAPKARLLVCWWGKEISIWRIARQYALEALPEAQRPRRLVAKILVDTRDKLTDVAISPDGRLLGASTNSEVKVFQLRKRLDSDGLAVRKIAVPEDMADSGARRLSISPDGLWLTAVTPESEVQIVRIAHSLENPKHLVILDNVVELDRQRRQQSRPTGLRSYDRVINSIAFSADSSVLVAGDLSGYLDTWILKGRHDITAPQLDFAKHDSEKGSSVAESEVESSDSDDSDEAIAIFHGQHWAPNPAGHLLPKLDSVPVVVTFRPQTQETLTNGLVNGNPGVHSTRNNPHAHSHELPHGPHKLFVVTARHQIYELDILAGRFTDWGRRNSSASLPEDFTKIKDRAIGAVWDTSASRERIWLYGSTWVFMLDAGQDLSGGSASRKRRLSDTGDVETQKRVMSGSGAGDRLPVGQRQADSVLVTANGENKTMALTSATEREPHNEYDEEEDPESENEVRLLSVKPDGDGVNGEVEGKRKWWSTFKYRPILGMVLLDDDIRGGSEDVLEVVIVERGVGGKDGAR